MPLLLLAGLETGMVTKQHVLWFIIGVLFALFVLPMVQQFLASRKQTG